MYTLIFIKYKNKGPTLGHKFIVLIMYYQPLEERT